MPQKKAVCLRSCVLLSLWQRMLPWASAGALAIALALIATAVIALRRAGDVTPGAGPTQFTIAPPENTSFGGPLGGGTGSATQVAVSPDGRNIVFVAGAPPAYQIWLRPIAALAARPIPGTEGGRFPFWSPDSRFIGFFAGGKLKKVAIAGGPPTVLCDSPDGRGGSWSRDNVLLFAPGGARSGRVASSACLARAGCRPPSRPLIQRPEKTPTCGRTFCPMAGTSSTPPLRDPAVLRRSRR